MYMYISRSGNGIYRAGHTTRELEHGQYLGRGITIVYSTELKSKAAQTTRVGVPDLTT